MKLSAILITKNEERNIEGCLASLDWLSEVILVDTGSTDRTLVLAGRYPNVKIFSSAWYGFSETKRIAVEKTTSDWILWVDADELVPDELREEIAKLPLSEWCDAYDMPRKTFFLGHWVRHTGWYPGRVVRLFNKRRAHFNDNILHEGLILDDNEKLGHLRSDILHYSYTSLYQYFDKMNVYGKYGAEEMIRKGKKVSLLSLIANPLATFFKFYFLKKGFLDGSTGLIISIGSAFSNFIRYTNCYYLQKK